MDFLACPDRFPLWRVAPPSLRIAARRDDAGQRPYLVRGAAGCDRSRPVSDHTLQRLVPGRAARSEEHTSELQSRLHLVCRLLLEKKKSTKATTRLYSVLA